MIISCASCKKKFNLPETAVPAGKNFSISCPNCQKPIKISANTQPSASPPPTSAGISKTDALKQEILSKQKALPPMPQVLAKARAIVNNSNAGTNDLAKVLETDQAITARILKLANSAFYGLSRPIPSVQDACMVLGEKSLMSLITVVSTSQVLGKHLHGYDVSAQEMFKHSLATAMAAQRLAKTIVPDLESDAFSAGLLHDAGKLILDAHLSAKAETIKIAIKEKNLTFLQVEQTIFGFTHAEIGAEFCKDWQIPEIQADAIRHHHAPGNSDSNELAHILYISDFIAKTGGFTLGEAAERYPLNSSSLNFLGISEDDLAEITQVVIESVNEMAADMLS